VLIEQGVDVAFELAGFATRRTILLDGRDESSQSVCVDHRRHHRRVDVLKATQV
jgi:hypothetical protein